MKRNMSNPALYQQLDESAWLMTPPGAARKRFESHDFAGYGSYGVRAAPSVSERRQIEHEFSSPSGSKDTALRELEATAISGNDILSSTFYVSGLVTLSAGIMAPVCLALVGLVLYLFRGIYHETVMALPCNGGTYNILLNCTSKQFASMAAVFAIIAYITTGVVSALEAIAYLQTIMPSQDTIDTQSATIGLLLFFCILTNCGMQESATFAKIVFIIHVATLSLLTFFGVLHLIFSPTLLYENWASASPYPDVDVAGHILPGTLATALFYGFSSAMLGVSGFETSSQFVEEQAPGVFPKTLRNMWAGVMFFNPLLSLISFSALTVDEIKEHHTTVLARTAHVVGHWVQTQLNFPEHFVIGPVFSTLVSLDAFVVLAAALLTGYVGINGLLRRMSMDRCLPQFLLITNPWTGTDSFILVGFFLLCVSQVIVLDGNVEALGGVYCYAFLSVMTIFAFGNILLKYRRPSLPREVSVSWTHSIIGLIAVIIALLGNILGKPDLLTFFFVYVLIVGLLVLVMFQRVRILRLLFKLLKSNNTIPETDGRAKTPDEEASLVPIQGPIDDDIRELVVNESSESCDLLPPPPPERPAAHGRGRASLVSCLQGISLTLKRTQDIPFIFFLKHDDLYLLNKAMLYIQRNEQTNKIIVVHCSDNDGGDDRTTISDGPPATPRERQQQLTEHVKLMDLLYPRVKVSLLLVNAAFSATTVEWLSRSLDVPINAMFISCPDENFAMKISQLRGMRIIFSYD